MTSFLFKKTMVLFFTCTPLNKNILCGTEISSEGLNQIQISCVALQWEMPVLNQKLINLLSLICQYALKLLWLSLDTCSVDSKYQSCVTLQNKIICKCYQHRNTTCHQQTFHYWFSLPS